MIILEKFSLRFKLIPEKVTKVSPKFGLVDLYRSVSHALGWPSGRSGERLTPVKVTDRVLQNYTPYMCILKIGVYIAQALLPFATTTTNFMYENVQIINL